MGKKRFCWELPAAHPVPGCGPALLGSPEVVRLKPAEVNLSARCFAQAKVILPHVTLHYCCAQQAAQTSLSVWWFGVRPPWEMPRLPQPLRGAHGPSLLCGFSL